jgi:hypothetical protein
MMEKKEDNLWKWALANRAPQNPSVLYEAVLIARIKLPDILQGHCFGLMLANRADDGGSIITCAQSFPEGETHELAYIRIWEPIPEGGIIVRPITKVVPMLQETSGTTRDSSRNREFFEGSVDMVDLAIATGVDRGGLVATTGFSRIGGTTRHRQMHIFGDLPTNPQTALNLVTGQRVPYVGQSDVEHGFTIRCMATAFDRVHQGVPYLFEDGTIGISKASGILELPAVGDQLAQNIPTTGAIAFVPNIK